jgi:hypothetical protein
MDWLHFLLQPLPSPGSHSVSAPLAFLLSLEHTKLISASGPLYQLFLLPRTLPLSQISAWLVSHVIHLFDNLMNDALQHHVVMILQQPCPICLVTFYSITL